jgi:hypothetical protein
VQGDSDRGSKLGIRQKQPLAAALHEPKAPHCPFVQEPFLLQSTPVYMPVHSQAPAALQVPCGALQSLSDSQGHGRAGGVQNPLFWRLLQQAVSPGLHGFWHRPGPILGTCGLFVDLSQTIVT